MYSPFEKELSDLQAEDLSVLRTVHEGWYVEYKREVPNAASIAKSVSAFANTYGGWIFYGVAEKSKDEPVAGAFPGIRTDELDIALQRLRQAVAVQVQPPPHFDVAVLRGPEDAIELGAGRAVICIRVPWSPNTPHVHANGQIYRRVADGSEPRPEADRFVLDQLWRRGDGVRSEYARWVEKDPDFSKAEANSPYLRLLLVADLWKDHNVRANVTLDEVRAIMCPTVRFSGINVPFETVYTSPTGFIARQRAGNNPSNIGLMWRLRQDLRSEVMIPLNRYEIRDPVLFGQELSGYDHAERFARILQTQSHDSAPIIDLNFMLNVLTGIMNVQERLSAKAGWRGPLWAKGRLLNVGRTCPFVDIDVVLDAFEAHGVPMCLDTNVEVLPGSAPDTFVKIGPYDDEKVDEVRVAVKAAMLFRLIARAFGVPDWIDFGENGEQRSYFTELQQAGFRAMQAQVQRNARAQD